MSVTTHGSANRDAFEQIARVLSPRRAEAYRALGAEVVQGRREGCRVWDLDEREYIDCRSAGGVFNLGHRPPLVVDRLVEALAERDVGDWVVPSLPRAEAAQALAETLPASLCYAHLTATGSEAVEVACKLARAATGRTGLVCADRCYHGNVGFSLAMSTPIAEHRALELPEVTAIPYGSIGALDAAIGEDTAVVCLEPIQASAGVRPPPRGYLETARAICDERGAMLLLDEVQTGLGRTGVFWAFEHGRAVPDLLVSGKGLSGGVYPVAACCFGERAEEAFERQPFLHPSSFGGSELAAPVVQAVVEQTCKPAFLAHVQEVGTLLRKGLTALLARYSDQLFDVRAVGLMIAVETAHANGGLELMRAALDEGLLVALAHNDHASVLIMPPLLVSEDDVREILLRLKRAVERLAAGGPEIPIDQGGEDAR